MKMKPIEELTFTDDYMFGEVMRNEEICKGLLERLLDIKIDHVEYPELQKVLSHFYDSKGVRLDVYVDGGDRVFDIEVQNRLPRNLPKRARYYHSLMDLDLLAKGDDYIKLKESYVIFICKSDPFGKGFPCYHFTNRCTEDTGLELGDLTHKVIFNTSAFARETGLERNALLRYINKREATNTFTRDIDRLVEETKVKDLFRSDYIKVNLHDRDLLVRGYDEGVAVGLDEGYSVGVEEGYNTGMEEGYNSGVAAGIAEGESRGMERGLEQGSYFAKLETARSFLLMGFTMEQVAQGTGLPLETVQQLARTSEQ